MIKTEIIETPPIQEPKPLASLVYRYAASMLDGLIVGLFIGLPTVLILDLLGYKEDSSISNLFLFVINYGYFVYQIKTHRSTLGKRFFRLRVETTDYEPMSWGKAVIREVLGKILSSIVFGLGYVWSLFDSKKQCWHDKLAHTVVVQVEPLSKGRRLFAHFLTFGLVGLAILGIIATIILVAINPKGQLEKVRSEQNKLENQEQFYNQDLQKYEPLQNPNIKEI